VLLTAPSLRSDSIVSSFENLSKLLRWRGPRIFVSGEEYMMVLFGYFLIAAVIGIIASAVIGYFLANLIGRRFLKN
jgi:hypothetical protein